MKLCLMFFLFLVSVFFGFRAALSNMTEKRLVQSGEIDSVDRGGP